MNFSDDSNEKVIIMVVVFLVVIVMACVSTVLYNRKKSYSFIKVSDDIFLLN